MTTEWLSSTFQNELKDRYTDSEIGHLLSIFVEEILGLNRIQFRSWNGNLTQEQKLAFNNAISQLKQGQPYQQIIGKTVFFGQTFLVNEHTLIPRPETEELLEIAIDNIRTLKKETLKIIDIGTGSGIIPIILKKNFPTAKIFSVDISQNALDVAKENAKIHQVAIHFIHQDFLTMVFNQTYDIIISNPPYIDISEQPEIESSVKDFEPNIALFSPTDDALLFYRKIAKDASLYLRKKGMIFLEINQKLGKETAGLFQKFSSVKLIKDLSLNDRFIVVKKD